MTFQKNAFENEYSFSDNVLISILFTTNVRQINYLT